MNNEKFQEEVISLSYYIFLQHTKGESMFSLPKSNYSLEDGISGDKITTDEIIEKSNKILEKEPSIKKHLCPALKSISEDIKDIGVIVTSTLYPLSVAGALAIPANPLLFAGIVMIIFRAGIASFCRDETTG